MGVQGAPSEGSKKATERTGSTLGLATEGGENDPWDPGGEGVGKLLYALGDT